MKNFTNLILLAYQIGRAAEKAETAQKLGFKSLKTVNDAQARFEELMRYIHENANLTQTDPFETDGKTE